MKITSRILSWKTAGWLSIGLVLTGLAGALWVSYASRPDSNKVQAVADVRRLLKTQGFKTDVSEFDFTLPPEMRLRANILTNAAMHFDPRQFEDHPNLMQPVGANSALVIWKQGAIKRGSRSRSADDDLSWGEFAREVDEDHEQKDAVGSAILSGPIGFDLDAKLGSKIRLSHLAGMKSFAQSFDARLVLALHDGNQNAAWTNLLTETRLVTTWKIEPTDMSLMVRLACAVMAYNATWQALQATNWNDAQLAQLQREWESVEWFTILPETIAFKRAGAVLMCQQERGRTFLDGDTPGDFIRQVSRQPQYAWYSWSEYRKHLEYARLGSYEDETNLMLFFRDRETEVSEAIKSPNWAQMHELPGVTQTVSFQSTHTQFMPAIEYSSRVPGMSRMGGTALFSRTAELEAMRRILITALALERYHIRHGSYPNDLAKLAPDFLKIVPVDFMDGQPLRYRLNSNGHFLLYSVGLDLADNDGKLRRGFRDTGYERPADRRQNPQEYDLVWPLPAGETAQQEEQQLQAEAQKAAVKAKADWEKHYLTEISDREWQASTGRHLQTDKILAQTREVGSEEPTFKGQSAGSLICNSNILGTNQPTLEVLLKPRQIITGREPEDITLELPIRYDAFLTNNIVFPIVDADPESGLPDGGGKVYEREQATNGDCLLIWHAIYDPPGRHAVQVYLALEDKREGTLYGTGSPIVVTTSNLCQFSLDCADHDAGTGAIFHARLPEKNGKYSIECLTTGGEHLKTFSGITTTGEFKVQWDRIDDQGHPLNGVKFETIVNITLPDSGRSQTLRGP